MEIAKFTAGQWRISRLSFHEAVIMPKWTSGNPYPQVVADVYPSIKEGADPDAVRENLRANAMLVAAAPDMYALVRYLAQMQSCEFKPKDKEENDHLLHILSRATFMAKLLYGKVTDDYSQEEVDWDSLRAARLRGFNDIPLEDNDES